MGIFRYLNNIKIYRFVETNNPIGKILCVWHHVIFSWSMAHGIPITQSLRYPPMMIRRTYTRTLSDPLFISLFSLSYFIYFQLITESLSNNCLVPFSKVWQKCDWVRFLFLWLTSQMRLFSRLFSQFPIA